MKRFRGYPRNKLDSAAFFPVFTLRSVDFLLLIPYTRNLMTSTSFIRKRVATEEMKSPRFLLTVMLLGQALTLSAGLQAAEKTIWKPVAFAIVKFNGEAPKSWNMYHSEKKGLLLVHLWKRYLLLDIKEQEVYELDPQTVKPHGEDVEWSNSDAPDQPLEISEWKERNVGRLLRVSFRLGKDGHILELQIPLKPDGKPLY